MKTVAENKQIFQLEEIPPVMNIETEMTNFEETDIPIIENLKQNEKISS